MVIDLPPEVFQSFKCCGLLNVIKGKTYDRFRFFHDVFFPNVSSVTSDQRDVLVLYALNRNNDELEELIKNKACIPASPDGKVLKRPSHISAMLQKKLQVFCCPFYLTLNKNSAK